MGNSVQSEIFVATNAPGVYESGGKYGQKGVDFQRYWAISRIIDLVNAGEPDFLILFESLQDIVEFDSASAPTHAKVYQLKMKDTGEWAWKELTALPVKPRKKKNSQELTTPIPFTASPIGKLACTLAEIPTIKSEGVFVSNLGCSAAMEKGSTAGSVKQCSFSDLGKPLREQITPELAKLKKVISLDSLHLHKTELSLDDPDTHVTGKAHAYLLKIAPLHAGQCRSLSDSLFSLLSARGRKTDPPADFAELVSTRGFSKSQFMDAVGALCSIPDQQKVIDTWLTALLNEKMPITELTRLQVKLMRVQEEKLRDGTKPKCGCQQAAGVWAASNPVGESIRDYLTAGTSALANSFPEVARETLQAVLFLEGVAQCLSPI